MIIRELANMANAVYDANPALIGFNRVGFRAAGGGTDGFQAAAFARGRDLAVVYRGTAQGVDVAADAGLGLGANLPRYNDAEAFLQGLASDYERVCVCGHSLGGAIAQIVANRCRVPMATFNAPGVAVFASRNLSSATTGGTAIRTVGMLASALAAPSQALRDMRSAFYKVRGINIRLGLDPVSQIGAHYGTLITIPTPSGVVLKAHSMVNVIEALKTAGIGAQNIFTL